MKVKKSDISKSWSSVDGKRKVLQRGKNVRLPFLEKKRDFLTKQGPTILVKEKGGGVEIIPQV